MKRKKINIKLGRDLSFRVAVLKIFIVLFYILLLSRLMYLQLYKGDYYSKLSKNNRVRVRRIDAPRGKIYDRNGVLLATNVAGYKLVYLQGRSYNDEILNNISSLTGMNKGDIEKRIKNGEIYRFTGENVLIDDLEINNAHKIMEKLSEYPYLDVISYSKRKYIYDNLASHTLGYVKPITNEEYELLKDKGYTPRSIIGKMGIEKKYDEILQGQDGYEYIEVNAYNRIVKKISNVEPIAGSNLYLSIDYRLQSYMEEIFREQEKVGSFIAADLRTGEIITILSNPEFSLNQFSSRLSTKEWNAIIGDKRKPMLNRAISATYPPGSVFKPASAMAFLEYGIDPNEEHFDPGYYKIGDYTYRSWKRWGHGYVDMKKSLVESANVYYYTIADQVGHKKILEVSDRLGIGEFTGIDLLEEQNGLLPSDEWKRKYTGERWYRGDTMNLTIGQGGLLVTPLQILNMYSVFANKGVSYKPFVLKKSVKQNGETEETGNEILTKFETDRRYFDIIDDGLLATVESKTGTARTLRTENMVIAAKTGTAENSGENTHAWIAGYFPYDDPKIVFVAFVEEGGGGSKAAAPVAKAFIDKYIELYKVDN